MKLRKDYLTIFIIQVTEVLGFSLILPFLPFYAQDLGASPFVVGLILASFSFFQLISAPIMGRISDSYGRKPLLMISQFSTFLGFLILGFADSLWLLFLSRIIDGLFGSNFTIAQAYLSDVSSKKDRSKAFGISGAAFGFGFLVGPAIGGYLANFSYSLPAFIAAGVSFFTIVITHFFLKETVKKKTDFKLSMDIFQINAFKKFFKRQDFKCDLIQFFSYVLTHSLFVGGLALYAERQIGFGPSNVGFVLAYIGLFSIILRGILLGRLIDYFGERKLQYLGTISLLLSMTFVIFLTNWIMFVGAMTLFSFGTGVLRPVLTGNASRKVNEKEQGTILGVIGSLDSLSRIFGPFIAGFVIEYFFPGSLGVAGVVIMLVAFLLMFRKNKSFKC